MNLRPRASRARALTRLSYIPSNFCLFLFLSQKMDRKQDIGTAGFEPATSWIRTRRPTRLGYVPGVGAGGVEPPASAFVVRCSIHLSYAPGMSRRQDSNLHPPGSKPGALPDCATPRRYAVVRDPSGVLTHSLQEYAYLAPLRPRWAGRCRGCGRSRGDGPRLPLGSGRFAHAYAPGAYLRPDRGVHRVGSGRRRRRSGRTGSSRPARGWSWSVDPWMLLAVFMTAFEVLYVLPEHGAVKRLV